MRQCAERLPDGMPSVQRLPSFLAGRWSIGLAGVVLVFALLAAYHNSFSVPFFFDDLRAITENQTIRRLWPLGPVLSPPAGGRTVSGRPVVNLSLAVNYAVGGTAVWGYHALNLAIHISASLILLGIVRRTLLLNPSLRRRFGAVALPLALSVALIWALHPLQTESITYVVQRAESLMGLFYLLTLYAFIRGTQSSAVGWYALAIVACGLGMATKEVMVSAPLIVWFYDRTFVAGSFRGAMRARWRVYAGLGSSWLLLAWLVATAGELGSQRAGFQTPVAWWSYALTQLWAIVHYLQLSVWPHPLVFDYGTQLVTRLALVVPSALVVVPLLAGAIISVWRWPALGFLGVCFFAVLAPTSSVMPLVGQTVAEHRMYLPLAAVVTLLVLGAYTFAGWRSLGVFLAVAIGLGLLTSRRNRDYRSEVAIWTDTAAKHPQNVRAHSNLGNAWFQIGKVPESIACYQQALQLDPHYADAHNNMGVALFRLGRVSEAISSYEQALRLRPDFGRAHCNLGAARLQQRRLPEAIQHLQRGLQLRPDDAEAHNHLGAALVQAGKVGEGLEQFEQAVRLKPDDANAQFDLANVLFRQDRVSEAVAHYQHALRVKPDNAEAHKNLAGALLEQDRVAEAVEHLEQALQIKPGDAAVHCLLGIALSRLGKDSQAVGHLEQVLRLMPEYAEAANRLGWLLATSADSSVRNGARAVELAEKANEVSGGKDAWVLDTLAAAYAEAGRYNEAVQAAERGAAEARAAGNSDQAARIESRLRLYHAGQRYHEATASPP